MLLCVPLPVCQTRRGKWSSSLLQHAEGMHNFQRHAVRADVEVDQRPRRLRAVVAVVGHGNLAHAVGFKAGIGGNIRQVDGVRHKASTVAAVDDRRTSFCSLDGPEREISAFTCRRRNKAKFLRHFAPRLSGLACVLFFGFHQGGVIFQILKCSAQAAQDGFGLANLDGQGARATE
jgi:hypothetical protein